jgi:choline dehydrogenase-like flavoprotein
MTATARISAGLSLDAPPRRALRLGPGEEHVPTTRDGVRLRLTRFQGGGKGPVLLSPGFGTSRLAFSIATVETNLPEYLYAHGYDVWLFDYRASPELSAAASQFTVDDIATMDYPAAVDTVRQVTGVDRVQVVAHCVGSMSFVMAMAAGLQGVRSAVCSQLAFHPISPLTNAVKAAARLPEILSALGLKTFTTDYAGDTSLTDRLLDHALKLHPAREHCDSPVCRRIVLLYGDVYKHAQLNEATHRALPEIFGTANLRTLDHLSRMVRRGQVVDARGRDVYLPHLDRLAIPITFLHGAENHLFLPQGTARTYEMLCERNGSHLYRRHVIPGYAHMDCFLGQHADRDVFPLVLEALERDN